MRDTNVEIAQGHKESNLRQVSVSAKAVSKDLAEKEEYSLSSRGICTSHKAMSVRSQSACIELTVAGLHWHARILTRLAPK